MGRRATLLIALIVALAAAVGKPSEARAPDLIKAVDVSLNQTTDDLIGGRYVVKVTCARPCTVSQGLITSRSDAIKLGLPVPSLAGFPARLRKQLIAAGARIGFGTTKLRANTPTVLRYRLDAKAKVAIAGALSDPHRWDAPGEGPLRHAVHAVEAHVPASAIAR